MNPKITKGTILFILTLLAHPLITISHAKDTTFRYPNIINTGRIIYLTDIKYEPVATKHSDLILHIRLANTSKEHSGCIRRAALETPLSLTLWSSEGGRQKGSDLVSILLKDRDEGFCLEPGETVDVQFDLHSIFTIEHDVDYMVTLQLVFLYDSKLCRSIVKKYLNVKPSLWCNEYVGINTYFKGTLPLDGKHKCKLTLYGDEVCINRLPE